MPCVTLRPVHDHLFDGFMRTWLPLAAVKDAVRCSANQTCLAVAAACRSPRRSIQGQSASNARSATDVCSSRSKAYQTNGRCVGPEVSAFRMH